MNSAKLSQPGASPATAALKQASRLEASLIGQLRLDLAEYTLDKVYENLSSVAISALNQAVVSPALKELKREAYAGNQVCLLARLFMLGDVLTTAEVDLALIHCGRDFAERIGLIRSVTATDGVENPAEKPLSKILWKSNFDLRPFNIELPAGARDYWFISDLGEDVTGRALPPDHVLGIGGATTSLLQLTPREPVDSALDIGTGCGIQAIILASHADRVVATDISQRALDIAAFNAQLNQVELDLRAGSMLEPVQGESFDLVVSNPPFVITPRSQNPDQDAPIMECRDGGAQDDSIVADLVRQLPQIMRPDGVAVMLGNWLLTDQEWQARPQQWLEGSSVDALVIQRDSYDPAEYATMWLRDGGLDRRGETAARFDQALDDYLQYFADRAAHGVGFGYLALRARKDGVDLDSVGIDSVHYFAQRVAGNAPSGKEISSFFAGLDWVRQALSAAPIGFEGVPSLALSSGRVKHAADVTEERYHSPGQPDPLIIMLHAGGSGLKVMANTMFAALFGACDGELTLGQITQALAALSDISVAEVVSQVEEPLRAALQSGMLLPVDNNFTHDS